MHKLTFVSVGLLLGLFSVGCGSSSSSGGGFSCETTVASTHSCVEYDDLTSEQTTAVTDACTAEKGTAGSSCSTTGALGTCSLTAGGITEKETFYSSGGLTAAEAESACKSGSGTWTAS
jgi:hypothetical protein